MSFSVRALAKRILPLSNPHVISAIRRMRDLRTISFALSPSQRRQVREAYHRCRSFEDQFNFARATLAGGALQNIEEIRAAIDYIRSASPRSMCEIGTANGGTNLLLSQSLASIKTIVGVDLFIMNGAKLRCLLRPDQQIHLMNGSSYAPQTFERVRAALAGQPIDLLFIDGDYRYEGVKRDFLLYRRLMREGGLIMFHDILPDHGTRHGRPSMNCAGDVPILWNQLKPHYRHREFFRDPDQDGLGLGILHWSESTPLPELTPPSRI
jgi:cephalosporin hydroxylase